MTTITTLWAADEQPQYLSRRDKAAGKRMKLIPVGELPAAMRMLADRLETTLADYAEVDARLNEVLGEADYVAEPMDLMSVNIHLYGIEVEVGVIADMNGKVAEWLDAGADEATCPL